MPVVTYPAFDPWRSGTRSFVGVFVGGCVVRGEGSSFRRKAHAHMRPRDPHRGWICVRSAKRLFKPDGSPSLLMWHELAHIVSGQGHTAKFEQTMRQLCGRSDVTKYRATRQARRTTAAKAPVRYRYQSFGAADTDHSPNCTDGCGRIARGWLITIKGNTMRSDAKCDTCAAMQEISA